MSNIKTSTFITGLEVAKDPHYTLSKLYAKIMRALENLPEDAAYRKYTQQIICNRLNVLRSTDDTKKIETTINCGQIEELIKQADCELLLARKMLTWKPWEPLLKQPPNNQWVWPPRTQKPNESC